MVKNEKIDFVVLWVDPNDKKWQKSRKKYYKKLVDDDSVDNREERYRDWGYFKYWFRGVERFAPWVNTVYLVTCGHVPSWLNLECPKLKIVKHSDIMPKDALPTFNSNAIELCVHNIKGLSENFVLFNDDMFIIKPVKPTDFFRCGVPVDTMSLLAITPSHKRQYCRTLVNNVEFINDNFDFRVFKKINLNKALSLKQGKYLFTTIPLLAYDGFPGFKNYHIGNSYLKSTFSTVWKKNELLMNKTVYSKFRNYESDINHWIMAYWQFASGRFKQRKSNFGISIVIDDEKAQKIISKQKRHIICLGEPLANDYDYEKIRSNIARSFLKILPEKSRFEL